VASTIFVIDSSPAVRRMVEQISTPEGFEVIGFQDGPAALEAARKISPRLIIADYHLDSMTFSGFCKEVYKLDHLTDTFIISLVSATDKLDESHLRSVGVKAFLKKPLQSENLLDLIKELDHANLAKNGTKKKRRSWPPTSSATDSDDDELPGDPEEEARGEEEDLRITIPFPAQHKDPPKKELSVAQVAPTAPTPMTKQPAAEPEEAMNGQFGQMFQSMSEKMEKKITELLPAIVGKDLPGYVANAVEAEVRTQIGASLSQERVTQMLEPLLAKELPKILTREMAGLEPIIRHSIFEIASPLIKDNIEQLVREQAETAKTSLPDAVRDYLKSIEELVRDEIRLAATAQIEKLAADLLHAAAEKQIQQAVEKLVPTIAEDQIKAEIARLTNAA
jgi:CheY-like chemotaxis protein